MGRARNVTKESDPVTISDGDVIHLRRRLGVGEATRMRTAGIMGASNVDAAEIKDRRLDMDMARFKIARVLAWITGWTLKDDKGEVIPLSVEGVESLDEEIAAYLAKKAVQVEQAHSTTLAVAQQTEAQAKLDPIPPEPADDEAGGAGEGV